MSENEKKNLNIISNPSCCSYMSRNRSFWVGWARHAWSDYFCSSLVSVTKKKTSLKIGLLICFRLKVAKSIVTFQISKSIKHALNTRCIICKPLDLLAKVSIISNPNSNPKTNPCTRSDYRAGFQKTFQNLDCENFWILKRDELCWPN